MLAKKRRDPEANVSEEEQFILQSTKYLANDQVGAFYLSKKNPFPTRHFSNPSHISTTVQQARQALAKHKAERECEDHPVRHTQSAGAPRRLSATLSVVSTTSGVSSASSGSSSSNSSDSKPRPQTGGFDQRRQVHFEREKPMDTLMEIDNHRKKTGKTVIPRTLEAAQCLERRPHTSPFHPRNASTPSHGKISDWVAGGPTVHPTVRRTKSFEPHTPGSEFGRVFRARSQSITEGRKEGRKEGRIMREMRQEKDAADEKVKAFLSRLKEEGLAAELHSPRPTVYYRHVTVPGPKDYWRRLGERVMHQREEERRRSQPRPSIEHQLQTEDRAKKHSVTTKLQNVVKNIMKMKRTCEILEYEKLKKDMATEPNQIAEIQTQTLDT